MMQVLLDVAQTREADRRTIAAGTPGIALMERAGAAVADAARAMRSARGGEGAVLVACGPGNNGGDGFVAARHLEEEGIAVVVALLGPRGRLRGDAAIAAASWSGPVLPLADADPQAACLVIDALFGSGLARPIDGPAADFLARLAASGRPVLAVDVPSGLDGDTGGAEGPCVRADETITFATMKPGHLLLPGRTFCGRVRVADIGIPADVIESLAPATFANGEGLYRADLPRPGLDAHKYARGHVLVLSGGIHETGAARLVARGALRIGAGAVTLGSPRAALLVNATQLTAIMLRPCDDGPDLEELLADPRIGVLALGPGLGRARARGLLEAAARAPHAQARAIVIDADALTAFEGDHEGLADLLAGSRCAVATPHAGELSRLFRACPAVQDAPSKLVAAREAAAALGAIVVAKGADSVIAAPDGRAAINASGTPYLATAGAGDVLAGFVAGLIAQGMPPFEATAAAVDLHARAGAGIGPGLIAEDLPEAVPGLLAEVLGGEASVG